MDNKMEELVEKLLSSTEDGKTKWEEATSESSFLTSYSAVSILLGINHENDWNIDNEFELSIINSEGKTIEEYTSQQGRLRELWERARSSAFGAEEVIDALINQL